MVMVLLAMQMEIIYVLVINNSILINFGIQTRDNNAITTFPIAYTKKVIVVGSTFSESTVGFSNITLSTFKKYANGGAACQWLAIGY